MRGFSNTIIRSIKAKHKIFAIFMIWNKNAKDNKKLLKYSSDLRVVRTRRYQKDMK